MLVNEKGGAEKLQRSLSSNEIECYKKCRVLKMNSVPAISRYANSQNKVSDVDLASNHPFHKKLKNFLEKFPQREDGFPMERIGITGKSNGTIRARNI